MRQCAGAGSPVLPRLRERCAPGRGTGCCLRTTVPHIRTAHATAHTTIDPHSANA
jgi:hypothetical protein